MQSKYQSIPNQQLSSSPTPIYSNTNPGFFSKIITLVKTNVKDVKPVSDFFDYKRLSKPTSLEIIQQRASLNAKYFRSNYLLLVALFSIYALLTSPWLLAVIMLFGGAYYWIARRPSPTITIQNQTITKTQMNIYLGILSIPFLWWTAAATVIFWIATLSGTFIGAHASCMEAPVQHAFGSV
ncbi:hypothetical protein HMI55_001912 [Coelomomyces lativittatus]|nr:hypothetical protein HMI56_001712 [Coelomomyces lativittatus]KAJ1516587.1 hypothetical protein HMI55_001912 [Coelomomyces lativittatus]